jgi:hypothetical protein
MSNCVAVGQSGFISCQGFLHFVRNCEKESSSKCVSILCYLGDWVRALLGYLRVF